MKIPLPVLLLLTACGAAYAQHSHSSPESAEPVALVSGLGNQHHRVSTTHPEAQRFFVRG